MNTTLQENEVQVSRVP